MRLLSTGLAAMLALALVPQAEARDKRHGERKAVRGDQYYDGYRGRSSTVDRRGLCQRDNGRPLESLNLNHECDRQEFWARFNDYGDNRR